MSLCAPGAVGACLVLEVGRCLPQSIPYQTAPSTARPAVPCPPDNLFQCRAQFNEAEFIRVVIRSDRHRTLSHCTTEGVICRLSDQSQISSGAEPSPVSHLSAGPFPDPGSAGALARIVTSGSGHGKPLVAGRPFWRVTLRHRSAQDQRRPASEMHRVPRMPTLTRGNARLNPGARGTDLGTAMGREWDCE
ncbi:hypothetical protein AAFF_G00284160 [Aldrovandia affinis]|uniref:Uncharacterized protein n=1 Tax=Aldrovandia affinis TaxID=143900 RepID=A0AAD7TA53_9TELE|nr:hypothetical protein AAFF_G00284160 [Aldrovandia affinis]